MSRRDDIEKIVKARNKKGDLFQEFISWLTNVDNGLQSCKKQFENPEIARQIDAVKLNSFLGAIGNISERISEQRVMFEKNRARFQRKTITIAVIGEARIGKSTFLQSFTGLNDNQIPAKAGNTCTSTQSIISHIDADNGYAVVHYYSKEEFLNKIVRTHYKKLGWDPSCLVTISDFQRDFVNHERPVDAVEIKIYDNLKPYYDNFDEICRNVFDQFKQKETINDLDTVSDFVTYTEENGIVYSRPANLVVKKVEIFCKFPVDDVGQISVIDTPGMGTDTEDRDKDILEDVLNNSADFVLLFGAPETPLSSTVLHLCSTYKHCMPMLEGQDEEAVRARAFFLANQGIFLNEDGSVKRNSTTPQANQTYRQNYDEHVFPAAKYITLDARNQQQVQEEVLDELLDYLSENFDKFDNEQANAAKEILAGIGKEVDALLADIDSELGFIRTADPNGYSRQFVNDFEQLWPVLSGQLSGTVNNMMPSREKVVDGADKAPQGNVFTDTLKQIVGNYRDEANTPDFLTINAIRNEMFNNPGQGGAAFFNLMSHLRCYIIGLFAAMDANCQQIVEEAKTKLENVFRASDAGCMGRIKELDDKHGSEFFATLARFAQITKKATFLAEQLETYAKFNLSFSGFMAHKVSKNLDSLRDRGYKNFVDQIDFSSAEAIQEALKELGEQAINAVATELRKSLSSEPNEAVFAMSENFVDITFRTKSVKDEWNELYFNLKGDVWPEHFNPNHSTNRSMLQMRENLSSLKSLVDLLKELTA